MKEMYLDAGKIVNTHGIRGEVRVYPLCDDAEFLTEFSRFFIDGEEVSVISSRVHKNQALIRLEDIDTIDKAETLVGKIIKIHRDDVELDEGQFFIEDLKGLHVFDADNGKEYGVIVNIIQTGANDVFEVQGDRTYLVPKIDSVVLDIDTQAGRVMIRPLEGLFDE